jgi:hypothetical protein
MFLREGMDFFLHNKMLSQDDIQINMQMVDDVLLEAHREHGTYRRYFEELKK